MITGKPGRYFVRSKKGKHLGGPYRTKGKARARLRAIEYFKQAEKRG